MVLVRESGGIQRRSLTVIFVEVKKKPTVQRRDNARHVDTQPQSERLKYRYPDMPSAWLYYLTNTIALKFWIEGLNINAQQWIIRRTDIN